MSLTQTELEALLKKIKDGDQPVLVCTHIHPGPTPWEFVEGSCGLCGGMIWTDVRNGPVIIEANLMPICIPCLAKHGLLDEAIDHLKNSDKGSLIGGQFMNMEQAVGTVMESLNPTPKDDTN